MVIEFAESLNMSISELLSLAAAIVAILTSIVTAVKWLILTFGAGGFVYTRQVRKYRENIAKVYKDFPVTIPSRSDLKLHYVPLRVRGEDEIEKGRFVNYKAQSLLDKRKGAVILGAPGSGKSTFLRSIMRDFCRGEMELIPIFIELRGFYSVNSDYLSDYVYKQLKNAKLRNPKSFFRKSVKKDRVVLLMDGLDEIPSDNRSDFPVKLKLFSDEFTGIPCLVTCRRAVYHGSLKDVVGKPVELMDFNDDDIRDYLTEWPTSENRSAETLISVIRERPRINEIARTPLLLSMVANMYFIEKSEIPRSRALLYKKCTELMLHDWKEELNSENSRRPTKKLALQHLAVYSHKNMEENTSAEMRYLDIQMELSSILEKLAIENSRIFHMLDEIVERGGLLIKLANGELYKFSHLTFQEYFVATAYLDNPDALIEKLIEEPDRWREPFILLCGLNPSHEFAEHMLSIDVSLACACIIDSPIQIEERLLNKIIEQCRRIIYDTTVKNAIKEEIMQYIISMSFDIMYAKKAMPIVLEILRSGESGIMEFAARKLSYMKTSEAVSMLLHGINSIDAYKFYEHYILNSADVYVDAVFNFIETTRLSYDSYAYGFVLLYNFRAEEIVSRLIDILQSGKSNLKSWSAFVLGLIYRESDTSLEFSDIIRIHMDRIMLLLAHHLTYGDLNLSHIGVFHKLMATEDFFEPRVILPFIFDRLRPGINRFSNYFPANRSKFSIFLVSMESHKEELHSEFISIVSLDIKNWSNTSKLELKSGNSLSKELTPSALRRLRKLTIEQANLVDDFYAFLSPLSLVYIFYFAREGYKAKLKKR